MGKDKLEPAIRPQVVVVVLVVVSSKNDLSLNSQEPLNSCHILSQVVPFYGNWKAEMMGHFFQGLRVYNHKTRQTNMGASPNERGPPVHPNPIFS